MTTLQISESIVKDCKEIINKNSLQDIKEFWKDLQECEYDSTPDWPWIFQKIYIHACLKGKKEIAEWVKGEFEATVDPIQRIAYRQTYSYGNFLLQKALEKKK
jgi:hypothetical protein